jgi:outer membrane lipoprotein carrier protein
MKKYYSTFIAVFCLVLAAAPLSAYKFDFITVSDIVKKVQSRFGELNSYQANFTIVSEKMGKKTRQKGQIKYKSRDRLSIDFYQPYGQKIVSDGKMMWIYIPSMNVVAEQDLKSDSGLFSAGTKTGLNRLFRKYHYRFAGKEQPEVQKNGDKYYTLVLKQKESRSGYRTLKLWVSEDFIITRAQGETSSGKKVDIEFSNIKTDVDLPNGIFKFDIPSRARVIKNPMITEE